MSSSRPASWSGGGAIPASCPLRSARARSASGAPLLPPLRALDGSVAWVVLQQGADRVAHTLQQELVAEGVLHTTVGTTLSCMRKFEGLDLPTAPSVAADTLQAPAVTGLAPTRLILSADEDAGDGSVVSKAACLAAPVEAPEESNTRTGTARAALARLRAPATEEQQPQAPAPSMVRTGAAPTPGAVARAGGVLEAEDAFCHVELWQRRVALLECGELAAEYLQKAACVRRKRRLALVRAVREARNILKLKVRLPAVAAASNESSA